MALEDHIHSGHHKNVGREIQACQVPSRTTSSSLERRFLQQQLLHSDFVFPCANQNLQNNQSLDEIQIFLMKQSKFSEDLMKIRMVSCRGRNSRMNFTVYWATSIILKSMFKYSTSISHTLPIQIQTIAVFLPAIGVQLLI